MFLAYDGRYDPGLPDVGAQTHFEAWDPDLVAWCKYWRRSMTSGMVHIFADSQEGELVALVLDMPYRDVACGVLLTLERFDRMIQDMEMVLA